MNGQAKRIATGILALLLAFPMILGFPATAAEYGKVVVTAETTPIYERANVESEQLATAKRDFSFTPVGSTKSFWKIEFRKKDDDTVYTGYILKEHAGEPATPAAPAATPKPTEPQTHATQPAQTAEQARTVYWVPKGKSYHYSKNCSTLKRSKTIYSGTQAESGKYDPCNVCAGGR